MLIEAEEPYAIEIGPYGDDWLRAPASDRLSVRERERGD